VLAGTKLIAEAWDAAGLYQVGTFVGDSWKEWNGQFRDDVRSFMKADRETVSRLGRRLLGSPDIYGGGEREPEKSINFVTCHDGFTLNDLVSYNTKHNAANGEGNRDGSDSNLSWNCGAEGPTDDQTIERLRNRQVKNFLALTLLSTGAPILLMGDEVRRTQRGNNNAYCQDNDISWFDWSGVDTHADTYRFTRLVLLMRSKGDRGRGAIISKLNEILQRARIEWHGVKLRCPDWSDDSHSLALTASTLDGQLLVHFMANAFWQPLAFELPPATGLHQGWHRAFDTFLEPPHDISDTPEAAPPIVDETYAVQPRSLVLLFAVRASGTGQGELLPG
jgi:glycogen operon protein